MPVLTPPAAEKLDHDAATSPISDVAGYLQDQLGQRIAAHLVGLRDAKQIGRYRKIDGPSPNRTTDLRLREGYKIVRMIVESFDEKTARAWLFGTNTRLDDEAPIDVLRRATETSEFAAVRAAARQLVSLEPPPSLLIWRGLDAWRTEVAAVRLGDRGLDARGTQVAADPIPYRLDYRLEAPEDFVTARIEVTAEGAGWRRRLDLRHDGAGGWAAATEVEGEAAGLADPGGDTAALAGARDCDLGLSPLTNLMPIRRSRLARQPGAEDFLMAWISVPDLGVVASPQRYEHVRAEEDGGVVRYVDRGLFPGFEAELRLDPCGLVRLYPGLAERVE